LIARFSPVFEYAPFALIVVTVFGATTAFVAATIAMVQFDIKRVIAYSTMSQLGYMFFALGVSAYGAAMFHLVTHAFFNALLFLGAGSVIHALSGEQDMRNMGGLHEKLPVTYALMFVGSLALVGIWPFAGFYSKDIILEAAWVDHSWFGNYAYIAGIATAIMTALYSWRLLFMTFHGTSRTRTEVLKHAYDAPMAMKIPLLVLSTGAILIGGMFYGAFVGSPEITKPEKPVIVQHHEELSNENIKETLRNAADESRRAGDDKKYVNMWSRPYFWHDAIYVRAENDTIEAAHHVPFWVKQLPLVMGILGIMLAYFLYIARTDIPAKISERGKALHILFRNKWFFDKIYHGIFVRGALSVGWLFARADKGCIDAVGPDWCADCSNRISVNLSGFQNGHIYRYAFVMIITIIGLMTWFILSAYPSFYRPEIIEEPLSTLGGVR